MRKILVVLLVFIFLSHPAALVNAQEQQTGPVYIVQPGDTLYTIALRFGITVDDIIAANQLVDPNLISAGVQLTIPGLEGVSGVLLAETIPLGVDLLGLSRFRMIDENILIKLNRLTSPTEIFAGANLILPQQSDTKFRKAIPSISTGTDISLHAATLNLNPWEITFANRNTSTAQFVPSEALFTTSDSESPAPNPLAPRVSSIELNPTPLIQGHTISVRVITSEPLELVGSLNGLPLRFFEESVNTYIAIQGIHAMAEPGLAPFSLYIREQSGEETGFTQNLLLQLGYYAQDPPLSVDPTTIDKANTQPEDDLIIKTIEPFTAQKYWQGIFKLPVDEPYCIKSWFGSRRSYNGSPYIYFHTGLDYGVCATLNILAPAPGVIVFSGPLTVRGNATIVDHGWGIYSGFWHQQESFVKTGERVETGQIIGLIGGTGRVTGPHLHWEVWANGVQVEPQEWLDREFP